MERVRGPWIVVAILAVIGVVVAFAAYKLFWAR
jgi:hypothetical protein